MDQLYKKEVVKKKQKTLKYSNIALAEVQSLKS